MQSKLIYMLESSPSDKIVNVVEMAIGSDNYDTFCEVLNNLDEKIVFKSEIHGMTHIERVCFLGLLLTNKLNLSDEDSRLVITACAYHDIGRQSEFIDAGHGKRAAEKVEKYVNYRNDDLRILKASIEAHSESDHMMERILSKYKISDMTRAVLVSKVLKDADGLDRVRISDLEPGRLRFKESLGLIDFAEDLFWFYH